MWINLSTYFYRLFNIREVVLDQAPAAKNIISQDTKSRTDKSLDDFFS